MTRCARGLAKHEPAVAGQHDVEQNQINNPGGVECAFHFRAIFGFADAQVVLAEQSGEPRRSSPRQERVFAAWLKRRRERVSTAVALVSNSARFVIVVTSGRPLPRLFVNGREWRIPPVQRLSGDSSKPVLRATLAIRRRPPVRGPYAPWRRPALQEQQDRT